MVERCGGADAGRQLAEQFGGQVALEAGVLLEEALDVSLNRVSDRGLDGPVLGLGHKDEGFEELLLQADSEGVSRAWFHNDTYFSLDNTGGSC